MPENVDLLARLQGAGFAASFSNKSLKDLGMDSGRVARLVATQPADAWVVSAGSRDVLEWFSEQPVPAIAMLGRFSGLPIAAACQSKSPAILAAVRKLVSLGHRRIVMLGRWSDASFSATTGWATSARAIPLLTTKSISRSSGLSVATRAHVFSN